jgi:hypothetical protein
VRIVGQRIIKWPFAVEIMAIRRAIMEDRRQRMSLFGTTHRILSLAAGAIWLASTAHAASAADTFLGKWTSNPPRCEQINGEVDVLTVTSSELAFYEIGCKLSKAKRDRDGVRYAARCYKGGSPETSGTVTIRRQSPDTIALALHGFIWTSENPETFHRCAAR